jgi:hypothetical protein
VNTSLRALALTLLVACGQGTEAEPTPEPTTGSPPTTAPDTTTTPTTQEEANELATLRALRFDELALAFSGVQALCDGTSVQLVAEYIGPVGDVVATPIQADGLLGDPVALTPLSDDLFRLADGEATGCDAVAWRFVVEAQGQQDCIVTGPGAADWLAASEEDCERR